MHYTPRQCRTPVSRVSVGPVARAAAAVTLLAVALVGALPTGAEARPEPGPKPVQVQAPVKPQVVPVSSSAEVATRVEWLGRKAWWLGPVSRHEALDAKRVVEVVVHHPDDRANLLKLSKGQLAKKLQGYRAFHMARGWSDIGYNFAVDGSGRVWDLASGKVGAHAATPSNPDQNRRSVGVLLLLGDSEEPNTAMRLAFGALEDRLEKQYPKITRVIGHTDAGGASTVCPGEAVEVLIEEGTLGDPLSPPFPMPTHI